MKKNTLIIAAFAALCSALAQASTITIESAAAPVATYASANAYQAAVDAALAGPGYAATTVSSYDNVTHQALFGGNSNFAMKSTIQFGAASDATWSFRAGVDFGYGAAMFLDNVALDFNPNDMWWSGSYSNLGGVLSGSQALGAGNHTLTIYGLEGCCDGAQQVQFSAGGAQFVSFGARDGIDAVAVPEPSSTALLLGGIGMLALNRRRKAAR